MTKSFLVFLILNFSFLTFHVNKANAVPMDSSRFKIESANIEISGGNKSSASYKLADTVGQLAAGQYSSTGYVVKAGFQYLHSIVPFSFSVSNILVNLSVLVPNISSEASTDLSVSFGGAGQYQVTAIEEGPLKTQSGNTIPDTECDDNDCDETNVAVWNSPSIYGFGYKMSGEDIPAAFTTCGSLCYRRFPDRTTLPVEAPAVIMSSQNVTVNLTSKPKDIIHTATVTFKANISSVQPAGSYQAVINFVATPSF